MPEHAAPVRGRVAIASAMKAIFMRTTFSEGRLRTAEVHVIGDAAYELGTYRFIVRSAGTARMLVGRYEVVWRHLDGTWKIALESSEAMAPL